MFSSCYRFICIPPLPPSPYPLSPSSSSSTLLPHLLPSSSFLPIPLHPHPTTHTQHTHVHVDGSDEGTEFLQKLDYLRTQAEVFLRMLNDMWRRLKELPSDALAAKQYRCVLVYLHMMSSTINTCTVEPRLTDTPEKRTPKI